MTRPSARGTPKAFARQLETAGVPVRLVLVQGAGHAVDDPSQRPTPDQLTEIVADFFAGTLASRP